MVYLGLINFVFRSKLKERIRKESSIGKCQCS